MIVYIKVILNSYQQWGLWSYSRVGNMTINFNISFAVDNFTCIANALIDNYVDDSVTTHPIVTFLRGDTRTIQPINVSETGRAIRWLAIGQ